MIGTSDGEVFQNEFDFVSSQFAVQSEPQKEPLVPDSKSIGEDFFERFQKMKKDFQNQVPTHEVDPPAPGNEIGGRPITIAQGLKDSSKMPPEEISKFQSEWSHILGSDRDSLDKFDGKSAKEILDSLGPAYEGIVVPEGNQNLLWIRKTPAQKSEPLVSELAGKQFAQAGNIANDASLGTPLATPSEKRTSEAPRGSEAPSNNDPRSLVSRISEEEGINPDLALRVARQESGFKQNVTSPAGAHGIMQLMPETAKELGVDPNVPEQNVRGGVRYLKQMLEKYGGDEKLALAAYNAGPGRVDRYLAGKATLPTETQNYVGAITGQTIDGRPHITVRKNWDEDAVSNRSQNLVSNAGDPAVNMDLTALYGTSPEAMQRSEEFKAALAQTWPAQAVQEFYQASTLPGRVASGETTIDQAIEEAGLFASVFTGGGLATAQLRENALGIFGGRLRSHADNVALNKANELEIKGVSPSKIWSETGWFKGTDGKWRNEINDKNATLTQKGYDAIIGNAPPSFVNKHTLENVLHHPELYHVYPELKSMPVVYVHKPNQNTSARYLTNKKAIEINLAHTGPNQSPEEVERTILHEIQHAVQKIEGFNFGTSPEFRYDEVLFFLGEKFKEDPKKVKKAIAIFDEVEDKVGGPEVLMNMLYDRTPGEIEARLVEIRRLLQERKDPRALLPPMELKNTARAESRIKYEPFPLPHEKGAVEAHSTSRLSVMDKYDALPPKIRKAIAEEGVGGDLTTENAYYLWKKKNWSEEQIVKEIQDRDYITKYDKERFKQ